MNCDDMGAVSHILNKKIVSVAPFTSGDGSSKVEIEMHIPVGYF